MTESRRPFPPFDEATALRQSSNPTELARVATGVSRPP